MRPVIIAITFSRHSLFVELIACSRPICFASALKTYDAPYSYALPFFSSKAFILFSSPFKNDFSLFS
jgi:hypothetical protein